MPFADVLLRFGSNEVARFLNSNRVFLYTLISIASVSAVITNALKNYSNFYSVAIYLSKSSRSVLALANFGVLLALLCGHIVQRIFFGSLRANEVERLYDRLWFFITESLLAFTIFRDEFDTPFALMFGFLLFVKSFHWLASDRIEWMDQRPYPGPPLLFHVRMVVLFALMWTTDCLMFLFAVEHTLTAGVGGMVLFASEYGILMASLMNTILKYLLSTYDLRRAGRRGGENAPPWENKSMWVFYIELSTDFLKLTTYLVFFIIIITFYGLPLNIVRDVYITARSFVTRLRALHRYQTATRNMDQRYPGATEEELSAMSDRTCIICREEMATPATEEATAQPEGPNTTPKKLPCGHIFHFHCLRSWLERQQSCPTCRRNVLDPTATTAAQPAPGVLPGQPPVQGNGPPIRGNVPPVQGNGPQPGNRQPPLNPQNAQGNDNNPLGFIGRMFGPGQNQAANRQVIPQNGNNNQGQGGVPGIFINYQVQYQFPRPNDGNALPIHQQPRHPVPPYPGFPGPGGIWQPWPVVNDMENVVDGPIEVESSDTIQANSGHGPPQDLPQSDLPATDSQSSVSSDPSTTSVTLPAVSENLNETPSPREAAARAALNRIGGQNPQSRPTVSSSTPAQTPSASSSAASVDHVSSPSTFSTTSTDNQAPPKPTTGSFQPPRLIPLYDFRSQTLNSRLPISSPGIPPQINAGSLFGSQIPNGFQHNRPANRLPPQPRYTQNFSSTGPQARHAQYSTPLPSQLPPTLTDEQLASLDVLTRESIDERLRILEGVSGAVYRCIDDLIRLRSALPLNVPATASSTANATVESASSPESSGAPAENSSTANGKEKMKEVPDNSLEPESSSGSGGE